MKEDYFRRQYFIGAHDYGKLSNWNTYKLNETLNVYTHPDLQVEQYTEGDVNLILLGFLIDPNKKTSLNLDILTQIGQNSRTFEDVLQATYSLSGRWLILFDNKDETKLVNDLIGLRDVYYTTLNGKIWCGTDPNLLNFVLELNKNQDNELQEYIHSNYFKNNEHTMYGNKTLYENTYHLMPNHYLDFNEQSTSRYWVNRVKTTDLEANVAVAANIIKHSLEAANERYNLALAVTAGLDSRVLLAATKSISNQVHYFVSQEKLDENHMDIRIPSKLLPKLNLKLNLITNVDPIREEFEQMLENNVSLFRKGHPRNTTTQYHYDYSQGKMNINGIVSEISREKYGSKHPPEEKIDSHYLMDLVRCPTNLTFAEKEIDEWLEQSRNFARETNFGLVNLFYWEQFMGNWGTLTINEEDIALESFMPFNNRKLLMTITAVDSKYREDPDHTFHKMIIEKLWPETLGEPINPDITFRAALKKILPKKVIQMLRNLRN